MYQEKQGKAYFDGIIGFFENMSLLCVSCLDDRIPPHAMKTVYDSSASETIGRFLKIRYLSTAIPLVNIEAIEIRRKIFSTSNLIETLSSSYGARKNFSVLHPSLITLSCTSVSKVRSLNPGFFSIHLLKVSAWWQ